MIGSGTFQKASRVRTWTLVLLVAGALLGNAAWHWAPTVHHPLAILLIAGIGLQHGALDHILHAHMHGDPEGPLRQSFALPYIAGIGVAWAAFETAPGWMLGLFLLVSAYHFGMSHLRVDALRRNTAVPDSLAGLVLGLAVLAPLITRPDALAVLDTFGWHLDTGFGSEHLPLQLASGASLLFGLLLHRTWRNGLLVAASVLLAWFVHDLLLAFALYFALGHSREAFFEEFKERQSVARDFPSFYLKSLPLSVAFAAMAGIILWLASYGVLRERAALSFLLAGTLPHIAVLEGWVTARTR
jgi:Brp/Blh family beta-carotene 15,15'-monooxygenase